MGGLRERGRLGARAVGPALAIALAVLAVPSVASADARSDARAHFKRGMDAIGERRFDEGIRELNLAYEILPHPSVLYNLGRAHAEAGHTEEALGVYRRYLAENPPDREEVERVVERLEAQLRAERAAAARPPGPAPDPATPAQPAPKPEPGPAPPKAAPAPAPAPSEPPRVDAFEEQVVTASRGAQSVLDAANSISIITEQDIRLSGITKVPELLRRLAGVDLMQVTGAQTEVAIRGFNQRLSNKTLVLVDGRSVYVDLVGATIWQALSIGVEDIERIEVVRGPGSALYGADAFGGVVNIITKRPGDGRSGVAGGYGSQATTHGSLWATGRDGDFAWRLSAGYDYLPRWSREVPNGRVDVRTGVGDQVESARTTRLDARATRRLGNVGTIGVGGGFTQGNVEILGLGPLNDIVLKDVASTDVTTTFESKVVDVRAFWTRFRADSTLNAQQLGQSLLPSRAEQNIGDVEATAKGTFRLADGVQNAVRGGAWYRYKDVAWSYFDQRRFEHHTALFLHDDLALGKHVTLVGDFRLDWVPYLARAVASPRGALLVHPTTKSTARASVGTAFRKPNFLESYLALPIQLPVTGGSLVSDSRLGQGADFRVQPERILNLELGYTTQDSDYVRVDASLYYARVGDLIQLAGGREALVSDLVTGAARQDEATALFPLAFGGFDNQCQVYGVYGGELGVRTFPLEGLDLYGNYTLTAVRQDNSGCTVEELGRIVDDQRTSVHKLNAGVQVRTKPGVDGSVDFHVVSGQTWAEQSASLGAEGVNAQRFELAAYTLLNARLGYRFLGGAADVSLVGFNLVGVEHRQHPFGQLLGRRVMTMFSYRF